MPADAIRTRITSNQIGRMHYAQRFTGDGFTTNFTLAFEVYYESGGPSSDSAEIQVFDNGLKLEKVGAGLEYGMTVTGGELKVISFITAPLSGHVITAEYRRLFSKT